MVDNDFSGSAKYYDLILDKEEFKKNALFVDKILKEHEIKTVLELGCGTGLYLFPLKNSGYDMEGLDISKEMLLIARAQDKEIKLYEQDMSNFKINKKYDSILCLNSSLVLLPNMKLIEKTLRLCKEHLNQKGLLILDLPNHAVEIAESDNKEEVEEYKLNDGILKVAFKDYKKDIKWVSEWKGIAITSKGTEEFTEYYEELIYNPCQFEELLKQADFEVINIYGTRKGEEFNEEKSYRRFYVCRLQ